MRVKGQLISKVLFGVFNSFKKWIKTSHSIIVLKVNFFRLFFLEEFRIQTSPLEINWPLALRHKKVSKHRPQRRWKGLRRTINHFGCINAFIAASSFIGSISEFLVLEVWIGGIIWLRSSSINEFITCFSRILNLTIFKIFKTFYGLFFTNCLLL